MGRPITLVKRGLVRLLQQYLNEVNAQQSRFNALVAAHVMRLEQRVDELERRAAERE
jgi:CHASE1-domain containing sensor protein